MSSSTGAAASSVSSYDRGKPTAETANVDVAERLQELINALSAPSSHHKDARYALAATTELHAQEIARDENERSDMYEGWSTRIYGAEKVAHGAFGDNFSQIKSYIKFNKSRRDWSDNCTRHAAAIETDASHSNHRLNARALGLSSAVVVYSLPRSVPRSAPSSACANRARSRHQLQPLNHNCLVRRARGGRCSPKSSRSRTSPGTPSTSRSLSSHTGRSRTRGSRPRSRSISSPARPWPSGWAMRASRQATT